MTATDDARLFLALWPDERTRAQLAAYRDAWRWPADAKPVGDEKFHLTLHFLGAFSRERIATLVTAMADVQTGPVRLRAAAAELWRGGIAVLRFESNPALGASHESLGWRLARLGVALDARPFVPHVTLARKARQAVAPAAPAHIEWTACAAVLVESMRAPPGTYRILHTVGSAGAD